LVHFRHGCTNATNKPKHQIVCHSFLKLIKRNGKFVETTFKNREKRIVLLLHFTWLYKGEEEEKVVVKEEEEEEEYCGEA
jgi:hypothetical protein